jgi:hypothetical protein
MLAFSFFFFRPYAPPEAIAVASRFIEDLQNDRIDDAYKLTDRGADIGKDERAFAANEDVVSLSSSRHPVFLERAGPATSRARRLARIVRGHRVEPESIYVYFTVGAPFLVRLRYTQKGWAVSYFEVHAE